MSIVWVNLFLGQLDINISPRLSSEYISYLENPVELLNEAAKAAEKDLWTLIQFTEDLRRRYGKEPRDMEVLVYAIIRAHESWLVVYSVVLFLSLAVTTEKALCKADGCRSWYQSDISIWQDDIHENKHEQEGI
jgi:hypothetical protein